MKTCSGHRRIVRGGINVEVRHVSVCAQSVSVRRESKILQTYYIQKNRYNQQIILVKIVPIMHFQPATRQDNTDISLGW